MRKHFPSVLPVMRIRRALSPLLTLDLRSLALLRVGLALALLLQLLRLLPDLAALYSDSGVLDRALAMELAGPWRLSVYFLNGTTVFVALLWALQVVAALGLLLGCRSRAMAIASFIGYASLLNRNPVVTTEADALLLCLLFWICLLPAGGRYAIDALQQAAQAAQPPAPTVRSMAALGLRLQVVLVFVVTAALQQDPVWRDSLSAFQLALAHPQQASWLGSVLREYPFLLAVLTAACRWTALLAPVLLVAPGPLRRPALLALAATQLLLWLLFRLDLLPWLTLLGLAAFLGPEFWDRRLARYQARHPGTLRLFYNDEAPGALQGARLLHTFLLLPQAELQPAQHSPRARSLVEARRSWVVIDGGERAHLGWDALVVLLQHSPLFAPLARIARRPQVSRVGVKVATALRHRLPRLAPRLSDASAPAAAEKIALAALLLLALSQLVQLGLLPTALQRPLLPMQQLLRLDQDWRLWSPAPPQSQGWIVVAARSEDGREIDLLDPDAAAPRYEAAALGARDGGRRWRLLEQRLAEPGYASLLPAYARHVCARWLGAPGRPSLLNLRIVSMLQPLLPPAASPEQQILWRQECRRDRPAG